MAELLNFLSYFFWVALALGILVFVHELGHFLTARWFGMRVDAFSIGFPPTIFKRQKGETEYRLGAIPLGGYVSIAGMIDESLDEESVTSEPEPDEYRAKPVWQRMIVISGGVIFNLIFALIVFIGLAYFMGSAYTPAQDVALEVSEGTIAEEIGLRTGDRVLSINGEEITALEQIYDPALLAAEDPLRTTVVRGADTVRLEGPPSLLTRLSRAQREAEASGEDVSFSRVFGALPQQPTVIGRVMVGSAADDAGVRPGDRIVRIGDREVNSWSDLTAAMKASNGEAVTVVWLRPDSLAVTGDRVLPEADSDRASEQVAVMPSAGPSEPGMTRFEETVTPTRSGGSYRLGVTSDPDALGRRYMRLGPGEAVAAGVSQAWDLLALNATMIGRLVTGRESVRENVGGPLIIAKQTKEAADAGGAVFWRMVGLLSIALAIFNILPIPALDGGHLVFLLYEAITRREPSLKVRMVVQQVGMFLILALLAFVLFNDAVRWFG